jgi:ligand-binding sensor domain-containing protein
MHLFAKLFFSFTILLSACNSQSKNIKPETVLPDKTMLIGDTVKQLSEHIWYVFQDSKKNYWFGSDDQGVFRYDGKTMINFNTKHGLANTRIRQIQEDKFGNIFFSTLGGINKFDGQIISTLQAIESKDWKLEENDLWFSMLGKQGENGTYRYDGKNLYHLAFPKHYLHDEIIGAGINPFFSPYEVYSIYKDRKGNMWFGTSVLGACCFDGQSVKWMYERDLTIATNGGTFGIRSIFEDKQGLFWICNTRHQYAFDFEKTSKSDRLQYKKTSGIGNKQLFNGDECIYYSHVVEDVEGNIWFTTWDSGVFKYDGKTITNYKVKDNNKEVNLISMYKDRQGTLWLGTPENGAFRLIGNSFEKFTP